MHRLWIALRVFFVALFHREVAQEAEEILNRRKLAAPEKTAESPKIETKKKPEPKAPVRSEALTLLATLQREARLVDFLKEPLAAYSDAQVGAVARDVHRDCGVVLERLFALVPALGCEEEQEVDVPAGYDPGRYRLRGNVTGEPPYRGKLVHHGWEATKCDLPVWSGKDESARIVAPVEVEIGQSTVVSGPLSSDAVPELPTPNPQPPTTDN